MVEIFLINIVGTDRKGLTNTLTSILASHEVRVLDIGQAVIHDHLSLGILVSTTDSTRSCELLKEILFKSHEIGVSIKLKPISPAEYEEWVNTQGQERTIVTMLGRAITAEALRRVTLVLLEQGLNIEKISRLSRRLSLEANPETSNACVELSLTGTPLDRTQMHEALMAIIQDEVVDISVQADDMFRRNRRLVVFDMDSTLIQCEVIDELAKLAGVGDEVSAITERAMRGELDFQSSFRQRLALLRGLPMEEALAFAMRLPLMDGAARLISVLKLLGYKTAVCSGGFTLFGHRLQELLGIDYIFANELEILNGQLTGEVVGDIVDGPRKALLMKQLAADLGLSLRQVIAVGDGANDLPMIQQAGLGIAFRAKPIVQAGSKHAISVLGLDGLLYLIGVRDRDLLAID
ncbi:MAG: phosphoserine phosphatase SerB [Fimbriimonas sp.]